MSRARSERRAAEREGKRARSARTLAREASERAALAQIIKRLLSQCDTTGRPPRDGLVLVGAATDPANTKIVMKVCRDADLRVALAGPVNGAAELFELLVSLPTPAGAMRILAVTFEGSYQGEVVVWEQAGPAINSPGGCS